MGALLHTDSSPQRSGAPPMLQGLSDAEVMTVIRRGARKVVDRGTMIFGQGTPHDGIYLIESGRVRVFYTSPAGREVTLAYWHPGNFVGGPEVFGDSLHVWTGVATVNSSILHLKSNVLRALIREIPALGIGVIEGLSFKGKCYSAMAQMLGTRSISERLAHLLLHLADLYGVEEDNGRIVIAAAFTPRRPRPSCRRHKAVGDDGTEAPDGARHHRQAAHRDRDLQSRRTSTYPRQLVGRLAVELGCLFSH